MTVPTTELSLLKGADGDFGRNYLEVSLASSLDILDGLFNNTTGHDHSGSHKGAPVTRTDSLTATNGLYLSSGTVGLGLAPAANTELLVSGTVTTSVSGAQAAINTITTLTAQANSDVLYGHVLQPTFNDNGKTGVVHWGLYGPGSAPNFFQGSLGIGASPNNQKLIVQGTTSDSTADAVLIRNSSSANLLEVRDDGVTSISGVAGTALTVNGVAGQWTESVLSAASGAQHGLLVQAGSSSSDFALNIINRTGASNFGQLRGDGYGQLGTNTQISWGPGSTAANMAAGATVASDPIVRSSSSTRNKIVTGTSTSGSVANNSATPVSVSFGITYATAPEVIIGYSDSSDRSTADKWGVSRYSITTTGFTVEFLNRTGSTQTCFASWIAVGGA